MEVEGVATNREGIEETFPGYLVRRRLLAPAETIDEPLVGVSDLAG